MLHSGFVVNLMVRGNSKLMGKFTSTKLQRTSDALPDVSTVIPHGGWGQWGPIMAQLAIIGDLPMVLVQLRVCVGRVSCYTLLYCAALLLLRIAVWWTMYIFVYLPHVHSSETQQTFLRLGFCMFVLCFLLFYVYPCVFFC